MTAAVAIAPLQWSEFKDIDEVEPINDSDSECLADIRAVLKKHNRLDRFGVALLHSHFEVAEDEILLETANNKDRTLMIRPVKESESGKKVGTIWALRDGEGIEAMGWCRQYCRRNTALGHDSDHNYEK